MQGSGYPFIVQAHSFHFGIPDTSAETPQGAAAFEVKIFDVSSLRFRLFSFDFSDVILLSKTAVFKEVRTALSGSLSERWVSLSPT